MIKLFPLELQNNDPLALASKVKSIMHDIKATKVELDIPLIIFLKALYPTYSNYLESLQENGNLKDITFDSLVKKIAEREKAFGKKTTPESSKEAVCLAHKEKESCPRFFQRKRWSKRKRKIFQRQGGQTLSRRKVRFSLHTLQKKWIT